MQSHNIPCLRGSSVGCQIIDRVPDARPICHHFYAFVCVTAFQSNSHIQLSPMLEVTGSYNCKQFYILLWMIEHANSHSKTLIQRLKEILQPDEARDRRNVALKFLSDCWRAQSSKAEFLHQNFSMPNIFHDSSIYTEDSMQHAAYHLLRRTVKSLLAALTPPSHLLQTTKETQMRRGR